MPALLTSQSIRPKRSAASRTQPSTASAPVTSSTVNSARPPAASIWRTVSWQPSARRAATATVAPSAASRAAMPRPIPPEPPVTSATRPEADMARA